MLKFFRRGRLAPLAAAVAAAGVVAAVAVGDIITSTATQCATTNAATHVVNVDGAPVATVGGDPLSVCATATATATNQTVTDTVTTTVTDPGTTTAPAPTYLFDDEFNGPAGSGLDPTKWVTFGNVCPTSSNWSESCIKHANAFEDGQGDLVLRVTPGTQGRPYDGAEIATNKMSGYPSSGITYDYPPGTRLEARIKFAPGSGLWETFWSVPPEVTTANYLELDTQEFRGNVPFNDTCHTHGVIEYGSTINQGFTGWSDWHIYWQDYYTDHVVWGVDNLTCGTTPIPESPKESPILWNMVGPPNAWGGTGGPPPASDIPADMLVDYVRISSLGG